MLVTAAVPRDWTSEGVNKMMTIRNELAKVPSVERVSLSYEIPNGNNGFQMNVYKAGGNPINLMPLRDWLVMRLILQPIKYR